MNKTVIQNILGSYGYQINSRHPQMVHPNIYLISASYSRLSYLLVT